MTKPNQPTAKPPEQVYTLLVELGVSDDLPKGATGAGLLLYAPGVDEASAVRDAVAVLKQADVKPLDVTSYGTLAERQAAGDQIPPEEQELMARALAENAVIVAQKTWFTDEADEDD
ncbi:MAG: hypothetical protein HLUCCA05_10880 [Roseibaca calidilacus]|uniref:Uncharacterized protein n=1 Tax=Roseibaca calidilacus TaxID=1666912 RepID=A0A0P8AGR7_9RHOB|nr:hypothetical protein [Roseibaca calidilacus]KPP93470.1 MAG: hypothetical protein HLUCCA05_10880 [Roseibaca calidilacus]CUX80610.1 hypothetical protein Ga0058931_1232 [Roseibaca calidilacus]